MRVAALQLDFPTGETRAERIERVAALVATAPAADLLVLPELWDVGYFAFDDYAGAAAPLSQGPASLLAPIAAARRCTLVAGTVLERDGDRLHNTAAVIGPDGRLLGTYRKVHLFSHRSREADLLTPGDAPRVVDTPAGHIGLATCFDLRFPTQFAALREAGADVAVVPAAWPAARIDHWRVLLQARAIETQTPLLGANGVGRCAGAELGGASALIDAQGTIVASATGADPCWLTADLDTDLTHRWRADFSLTPEPPPARSRF